MKSDPSVAEPLSPEVKFLYAYRSPANRKSYREQAKGTRGLAALPLADLQTDKAFLYRRSSSGSRCHKTGKQFPVTGKAFAPLNPSRAKEGRH